MSENLQTNFKFLTTDEFGNFSTFEKNVLYIVDNNKIFKVDNAGEVKEIFKKVTITYVDENNNILEKNEHMSGEEIELLHKEVISSINDSNYSSKIYVNWLSNGNTVGNVAPNTDKTYVGDVINISLNKIYKMSMNENNQQQTIEPFLIYSNKKLYTKEVYLNEYCLVPTITHVEGDVVSTIIHYDFKNLVYYQYVRCFNFNLDLYLDEDCLKKIGSVFVSIEVSSTASPEVD